MLVKVTLVISDSGSGWGETWYIERGSVALAEFDATSLALARGKFLGSQASITEIRLSDSAADRDSRVIFPGTIQGPALDSDIPGSGVLWRFDSGVLHRASRFLLGPPDAWVTNRTVPTGGVLPAYRSAVDSFRKELLGKWALRVVDKSVANPARQVILARSVTGTQVWEITTSAPHQIQVGEQFTWQKAIPVGSQGLNPDKPRGRYLVQTTPTDSTLVFQAPNISPVLAFFRYGEIRPVRYVAGVINDTTILRCGVRKVGRGF